MLQHVFIMLFILNLFHLESSASKPRIIGGKNILPRKIRQPSQENYCYFLAQILFADSQPYIVSIKNKNE